MQLLKGLVIMALLANCSTALPPPNAIVQLYVIDDEGKVGRGTGFFITPTVIATAHHVIDEAEKVLVVYQDGNESGALVIATDEDNDVALLEPFYQPQVTPLQLHLRIPSYGEDLVAWGYPHSQNLTYMRGYVMAPEENVLDFDTFKMALSGAPGASGSPVMDSIGVLGVFVILNVNTPTISYAIPSEHLFELLMCYQEKR